MSLPAVVRATLLPTSAPSILDTSCALVLSAQERFITEVYRIVATSTVAPTCGFVLCTTAVVVASVTGITGVAMGTEDVPLLCFVGFVFFSRLLCPTSRLDLLSEGRVDRPVDLAKYNVGYKSPVGGSDAGPTVGTGV